MKTVQVINRCNRVLCEILHYRPAMPSDRQNQSAAASKLPKTPEEWRKWKEERKAFKRKKTEAKLLKEKKKAERLEEQAAAKKRKLDEEPTTSPQGRLYTVSIALPGSILDNAQSPELRTYLAGQIARAAVVFNVDEIIIFDETGQISGTTDGQYSGIRRRGEANLQLARILQYLECPQYLRKSFFPQHKDLQYAGLLNPLDCPHHMRAEDEMPYREGVVLDKPTKVGKGSFVNVGHKVELQTDKKLKPGLRVTVRMGEMRGKKEFGQVVAPSTPRTEGELYWGYSVRLAASLGHVLTECPYKDGYDVTIGTSERGSSIDDVTELKFNHMLVVFGGLQGLEASLDADLNLQIDDPALLFTHYLNTCPGQGSRTIRTEEAILITLSALRPKFAPSHNAAEG